ncbi:MAG: hypothetical protein LQ351_000259 [Letrouitia transgressa]|nr:MAG: hypothetical protein LQ351_000259 [Letrouitia transgressa]
MQQWASAVGNDAFTFSRLLPWYKKSPHYTSPPFPFPNSTNDQDPNAFNAKGGGPLQISFGGYVDPFGTWAQYALKAAGQKLIRGFQSGTLIGTSYCPFTIDPITAQRSSSESSFLQSVTTQSSYRINASTQWLTLYNNTLAERILFDGSRKTTGVRVSSGSTCYTLSARKEIILSAGVFQSPQLLMVSGIGGRQQLETHNIPLIQDLPGVGQNMWDHILFGTSYPVNVPTASAGLNNSTLEAAAVQAYNQAASGPLSIPVSGVLGWEKLPQPYRSRLTHFSQQTLARSFSKDWPELELLIVSGYIGYQRNLATSDPLDGNNYATIGTALVAPLSRGNVTLSSPRMADAPLINPNWLTHPTDIELAILAFKRGRAVWSALQDANLTTGSEKLPGAAVQTDEEILDFIRASLSPVWHAAGTCKMGRRGDGRAVVDSKHRVFGVRGLRVVDASVFPLLPPGHPQGTIYALAERVAGLLLEEGEEDEEGKEEASKEKYMRGKGRDGLIQD